MEAAFCCKRKMVTLQISNLFSEIDQKIQKKRSAFAILLVIQLAFAIYHRS